MTCQLCGKDLKGQNYVDGKTIEGPWANMCERCHYVHGCGLGNGRGQLYNAQHVKLKG